jgi:hypothetical protein
MNSFMDSKAMAKALRLALAERSIELSNSACLELVSKQFGFADWNTLSARIEGFKAKLEPLRIPTGWHPVGITDIRRYRIGLDQTSPGCALIECVADPDTDLGNERFACMMQSIEAEQYRGRKLKLTAALRSEDAGCGTIWMRVDGAEHKTGSAGSALRSYRFDNLTSRREDGPINGTTGWTSRAIVLDVQDEADSIHYGFFLRGRGKVWARNFALEVVSDEITVVEILRMTDQQGALPRQPVNLGFR